MVAVIRSELVPAIDRSLYLMRVAPTVAFATLPDAICARVMLPSQVTFLMRRTLFRYARVMHSLHIDTAVATVGFTRHIHVQIS